MLDQERQPQAHESHEWEDQSYHGSPLYYCEFCNVYMRDYARSSLPCPERERVLAQRAARLEAEERSEYQRILAERERFNYLHSKYGSNLKPGG
jgi:hypothetical protein